ncbi:MAG: RNA polymerase sigma-70 factor [Gemmatimonadales bacterium]|nr:RNA polymerase sigma-70 factor [Gemmatimonadota bacterium]MCC7133208.1 RNA polymerase sigma-70 factor [Gemmatimonadales bacterium]MDX2057149.1 RNA polymerase sigma-70 factor [Gemmatimonadales bacterium]
MSGSLKTPSRDLVERIRQGDRDAFEVVFRAYYAKLTDYANGLVRTRDGAEDVVQEVFVALWTQRERLTTPDNLVGYLYRAVRNRSLNQLRHRRMVTDWQTRAAAEERSDAPPADRDTERAEITAAVKQAVATLSPRCREVFELSRDRGLTYPEIAAALGISIKTVETLMGRALKGVRERLAGFRS